MKKMTLKDIENIKSLEASKRFLGNVIPGSSMTTEKGKFPFDSPPKITDAEDGIQMVFDVITSPASTRELIRTLEMGIPVDKVVDTMAMAFHGEGIVAPQALPIMVPAMVAMIERMAEIAGVSVTYSTPPNASDALDERRIQRLVSEMSYELIEESGAVAPEDNGNAAQEEMSEPLMEIEEVDKMGDEPQGLMSPPVKEGIV